MPAQVEVFLEVTSKRTFAVALEWPGWTRGGRDEDEALDALLRAGSRYAAALATVGLVFEAPLERSGLDVVERVPGTSGTEFGAPSVPPARDVDPLEGPELERYAVILRAAWAAFEAAADRHAADELRKGPRGGGRDVPKMAAHVHEADGATVQRLAPPPKGEGGRPAPMRHAPSPCVCACPRRACREPEPGLALDAALLRPARCPARRPRLGDRRLGEDAGSR
jgi:hypothetical protein